jgi:hypothetical protein
MISKTNDGAIVDWLEEIPLDEFDNEYVRMIVKDFRNGQTSVTEAINLLKEDCKEQLEDYINQNIELQELFKDFV